MGGPPPSNAAHALSHGLAAPLHRTLPLTQLHSSMPLSPHVGGIKSRGPDATRSCMCNVIPCQQLTRLLAGGWGVPPVPRLASCEDAADVGAWVQVEGPHLVLPMCAPPSVGGASCVCGQHPLRPHFPSGCTPLVGALPLWVHSPSGHTSPPGCTPLVGTTEPPCRPSSPKAQPCST